MNSINEQFKECFWCDNSDPEPMVSGAKMPMVCKSCGTGLGWMNYKQVRELINKADRQATERERKRIVAELRRISKEALNKSTEIVIDSIADDLERGKL